MRRGRAEDAAPGNPWSWRGCYWDHEPQAEVELLSRGFHIAFIMPDPGKPWDAWYAFLTEKHGLSKKPAFIGMSRGGVNEYDWTTVNPDKVSCIYADNPAIRPEAFDEARGAGQERRAPAEHLRQSRFSPRNGIRWQSRTRYHQLGGRITVMIKEGAAHHPHSLRNPRPIADWIVEHVQPASSTQPDFVDETFTKSYYYGFESSYRELKEEQTYATCRGPGFTECYDRYDATTRSPWGVTGMTIVVPKTAAPGKPWVFRADRIDRETGVVDLGPAGQGFSHRGGPGRRAIRPGAGPVGRRLQAPDRPRLFQEAGDGRGRDVRRGSLCLGHRESGQGVVHLRRESRTSEPHVENAADRQSGPPGKGRRAAHPRLRQPRPMAREPDRALSRSDIPTSADTSQ